MIQAKTMPVHGQYRYQVGEPYYYYDIRGEITHDGQFKDVVLVDEVDVLAKKRPFLIII